MGFDALLGPADRLVLNTLSETEPVTYAPSVGDPVTVKGIFDRTYVVADQERVGVSTTAPAVWFLLADLPSDPTEDTVTITIGGVQFECTEAQKDGKGGVHCVLFLKQS